VVVGHPTRRLGAVGGVGEGLPRVLVASRDVPLPEPRQQRRGGGQRPDRPRRRGQPRLHLGEQLIGPGNLAVQFGELRVQRGDPFGPMRGPSGRADVAGRIHAVVAGERAEPVPAVQRHRGDGDRAAGGLVAGVRIRTVAQPDGGEQGGDHLAVDVVLVLGHEDVCQGRGARVGAGRRIDDEVAVVLVAGDAAVRPDPGVEQARCLERRLHRGGPRGGEVVGEPDQAPQRRTGTVPPIRGAPHRRGRGVVALLGDRVSSLAQRVDLLGQRGGRRGVGRPIGGGRRPRRCARAGPGRDRPRPVRVDPSVHRWQRKDRPCGHQHVLRRRGATRRVIVPIASALVAHRDRYFDLLDEYRTGHVQPLVLAFSTATRIAAAEARVTADRVLELPDRWREALGPVRTGSATDRLLARLPDLAAFTAEDAHDDIGGPLSSTYTAIEWLADAEIVRPLTDRKRNQVWGAAALLDELDDLGARIERHARRQRVLDV
jgi:hypothetical protein